MSESGFGDFEFERKFFVRAMPAVAASDPSPVLIVQAYLFAADGYAVRIRLQGPAPDRLNGTAAELVGALGDDAIGTMTAKGPAAGGTRYEAERDLDPTVAGQIVARAEHEIVGYAGVMLIAGDGHITNVGVDPDHPRRAIATRMLLVLARRALAEGAEALTLEVRMSNTGAHELYRRFGFVPAGVRKNYYSDSNEDALIMWANDIDTPAYRSLLAEIESQLPTPTITSSFREETP